MFWTRYAYHTTIFIVLVQGIYGVSANLDAYNADNVSCTTCFPILSIQRVSNRTMWTRSDSSFVCCTHRFLLCSRRQKLSEQKQNSGASRSAVNKLIRSAHHTNAEGFFFYVYFSQAEMRYGPYRVGLYVSDTDMRLGAKLKSMTYRAMSPYRRVGCRVLEGPSAVSSNYE